MLFGGLALYACTTDAACLLVIVLFSLLIGRPFTMQYARESVSQDMWSSPQFVHTNRIITLVWLAAFAALVVADFVLLYLPDVPHKFSVLLTIGALCGAFKFTMVYPERAKKVVLSVCLRGGSC